MSSIYHIIISKRFISQKFERTKCNTLNLNRCKIPSQAQYIRCRWRCSCTCIRRCRCKCGVYVDVDVGIDVDIRRCRQGLDEHDLDSCCIYVTFTCISKYQPEWLTQTDLWILIQIRKEFNIGLHSLKTCPNYLKWNIKNRMMQLEINLQSLDSTLF